MAEPISLSLCIIAKDEERDLPRCLQSVQGVVDEMVVVDTGSTDGTVAVAQAFGARVFSFPWRDDFSAARNFALEQAQGQWILFLDADEELAAPARDQLRPLLAAPETEGYLLLLINCLGPGGLEEKEGFLALRLFRNRPEYRYTRRVHEQLVGFPYNTCQLVPRRDILIYHYGYQPETVQRKGKQGRNLNLLLREMEEGSADNFTFFNLGVEYQRLGRYREALACYQRAWQGLPPALSWASKVLKNKITCLILLPAPEAGFLALEEALSLYPDYPDLHYLLGVLCYQTGDYRRAVEAYHRCLTLPPPPPGNYFCEEGIQGARGEQALLLALQARKLEQSRELAAAGARIFPHSHSLPYWVEKLNGRTEP